MYNGIFLLTKIAKGVVPNLYFMQIFVASDESMVDAILKGMKFGFSGIEVWNHVYMCFPNLFVRVPPAVVRVLVSRFLFVSCFFVFRIALYQVFGDQLRTSMCILLVLIFHI